MQNHDVATAAGFGGKPPPLPAQILPFTPYRNAAGTMAGFLSVGLPSGLVVHGLKLMVGPRGVRWIAPPDIKRRDQDDRLVLGEGGKPVYDPVIEFRDRNSRDRFNEIVIEALGQAHPKAFDGEDRR
jgi:DNA-binding cell septation regulator SpoVG